MLLRPFKKKIKPNVPENIDSNVLNIINIITTSSINTIIDVGAHKGRFALAASNLWPLSTIYCFEPFPEVQEQLISNLKNTNSSIHKLALSDKSGIQQFYKNAYSETNSLLKSVKTQSHIDAHTTNIGSIDVEVTTLDKFCDTEKLSIIDILKIDAQGSSLEILKGGKSLLTNKQIKIIQCEAEFIRIYEKEALFHDICGYLENFDYHLYSLYNMNFDINNRLSWADALFICEKD